MRCSAAGNADGAVSDDVVSPLGLMMITPGAPVEYDVWELQSPSGVMTTRGPLCFQEGLARL